MTPVSTRLSEVDLLPRCRPDAAIHDGEVTLFYKLTHTELAPCVVFSSVYSIRDSLLV